MKLQNNFVQGKLNTDIDERLLPKGQYPFMLNGRVVNSGGANVGIVENHLGNEKLTDFSLTNAVTIGALADTSNQKIYYAITSDEKDLVVEYDDLNSVTSVLLESSKPDGVLNFNRNYLITGFNKIINGDFTKDILLWTDDFNPPRMVNIERAKTYNPDGFVEDDISVIKLPPQEAPEVQFTYTPSTLENNLKERFVSFAYRYKYLDGEYSALSKFDYYRFSPAGFDLDYQTYENDGMVNSFNALNVIFNTGSERVTDIQLVYKESNSNNVYLVETFNKKLKGWSDNESQSFLFYNSKIYTVLAEKELYRNYDNVPRLAKAQELIGNRVSYANYLEGFNLVDKYGEDVGMDYTVSLQTNSLAGTSLPYTRQSVGAGTNNQLTIDFAGIELKKNTRISFQLKLEQPTYSGNYDNVTDFILNKDYADVSALASDDDFVLFVQTILTNNFLANYDIEVPEHGIVNSTTGFVIVSSTVTSLTLAAPTVTFKVDGTPTVPDDPVNDTYVTAIFQFESTSTFYFKESAVDSSLKTNRSYEVGIVYSDRYNRSTPALTSQNNTLYIPQLYSVFQNKLRVTLNHKAPYWADRFSFVVKQNKLEYQTIYISQFYQDGLYRWMRLEGENKQKVREGDTLIVKSDLSGVVEDVIKLKVLEVSSQPANFITGNELDNGDELIEVTGLYAKVKPEGINMNLDGESFREFSGYGKRRYATRSRVYTSPDFGYTADSTFVPYAVNAGTQIRVFAESKAYGQIAYQEQFDKTFIVQNNYANMKEWFDAEVEDLGSFGDNRLAEYGFTDDFSKFYVRSNRDGTASRDIMLTIKFEILYSAGTMIFETEPIDSGVDLFFEDSRTFYIDDVNHIGNIQTQDVNSGNPAIFELDIFNCYAMGNGAESNRVKDNFNAKYLNIDYRPTSTTIERFKEVRRYADITYSATYNENTNVNGLNEFNLYTANYKEDIDKKYGSIQKLFSRDTDLIVFQEDKVSRVLYGKDLLMKADGRADLTTIDDVLTQQVPFAGEWGISKNPESFAYKGNAIYFTDRKRGTPMRLSLDGNTEICAEMSNWFKDLFKSTVHSKQVGAYDPEQEQYVLTSGGVGVYPSIKLDCSNTIVRTDFNGTLSIDMNYGIQIGNAGFSYNTNGVPVKFDLVWNGQAFSTGYVGDPSYNPQLIALGLPTVSGVGIGTLTFNKSSVFPPTATITVTSPFDDARFELAGTCVVTREITLIKVVSNDPSFAGLSETHRNKWINSGYSSPYQNNFTLFGEGKVSVWDVTTGQQGTGFIPSNGSQILMEAFSAFGNPSSFKAGGQFKYLLSNTLYTQEDIDTLLASSTVLEATEVNYSNGDVLFKTTWELPDDFTQQYVYLIWDYNRLAITQDTNILIYFDNSGSMGTTLAPLIEMRNTILKEALLPIYNNDSDLYDSKVRVIADWTDERLIRVLNMSSITGGQTSPTGETPEGNVIVLVFQDEAEPVYHSTTGITPRTSQFDDDIQVFRNRLNSFADGYYRAVVFQVTGQLPYNRLIHAIAEGTDTYNPPHGLSDREEFTYRYMLAGGSTPQYYLDQITDALTELGFNL